MYRPYLTVSVRYNTFGKYISPAVNRATISGKPPTSCGKRPTSCGERLRGRGERPPSCGERPPRRSECLRGRGEWLRGRGERPTSCGKRPTLVEWWFSGRKVAKFLEFQ